MTWMTALSESSLESVLKQGSTSKLLSTPLSLSESASLTILTSALPRTETIFRPSSNSVPKTTLSSLSQSIPSAASPQARQRQQHIPLDRHRSQSRHPRQQQSHSPH